MTAQYTDIIVSMHCDDSLWSGDPIVDCVESFNAALQHYLLGNSIFRLQRVFVGDLSLDKYVRPLLPWCVPSPRSQVTRGSLSNRLQLLCSEIDLLGEHYSSMKEEDRPSKVVFVILGALGRGDESISATFCTSFKSRLAEQIKHQQDLYGWSFVVVTNDTSTSFAKSIGLNESNILHIQTPADSWCWETAGISLAEGIRNHLNNSNLPLVTERANEVQDRLRNPSNFR